MLSDLADLDWDFGDAAASSPFAQFHWHPARFPPQIPAVAIGSLSSPGGVVLDPFAGCGTTLVEAVRQRRSAIGVDTNPVAALISQAKLVDCDLDRLEVVARSLVTRIEQLVTSTTAGDVPIPNAEEQANWYEERTLIELGNIWHAIGDVANAEHRLVFTASFSAILRFVCSQEQHWGWICDNVKPKKLVHKSAVSRFAGSSRMSGV